MEMLRAVSIGFGIVICLYAPTVLYYRRQIIESWKELLGLNPAGSASRTPLAPSAEIRRFRRSWPVTIFQIVVVLASASVAITGLAVAAVLSALICLLTTLSLGLGLLGRSAEDV